MRDREQIRGGSLRKRSVDRVEGEVADRAGRLRGRSEQCFRRAEPVGDARAGIGRVGERRLHRAEAGIEAGVGRRARRGLRADLVVDVGLDRSQVDRGLQVVVPRLGLLLERGEIGRRGLVAERLLEVALLLGEAVHVGAEGGDDLLVADHAAARHGVLGLARHGDAEVEDGDRHEARDDRQNDLLPGDLPQCVSHTSHLVPPSQASENLPALRGDKRPQAVPGLIKEYYHKI